VLGLWCPLNAFHSPRRETLYSLPYPLRIERHPDDRAVPHETRTFRAAIDDGVAPEHVEFADTLNRPGQSDAIYRAKPMYRLRSRCAFSREICWTLHASSAPRASRRTLHRSRPSCRCRDPTTTHALILSRAREHTTNQPERTSDDDG
jgi:hypothetical protein